MRIARTLTVAGALLLATTALADEAAEKAAVAAADSWLKRVDAGRYGASWDDAAALFRNAITKQDWEKALKGVRSPLGKALSRKVASRTYAESLPGAPDGKYVVLQYASSFESKRTAYETVTTMQEKDGSWRVSGYFIK